MTILIQPNTLIVDRSLPQQTLAAEMLAARRYDTFWDKGDEALARAALASDFSKAGVSFMRKDDIAKFPSPCERKKPFSRAG